MAIKKSYQNKVNKVLLTLTTVRESVHSIMLDSIVESYKSRDTEYVSYLLNQLDSVKGSFRIQAVIYYYQEIAGFHITEDGETYKVKFDKNSKHDVTQLNECKLKTNRFWLIAPNEKVLKVCELDKVFNGAVIQLARSLSLGNITMKDVELEIASLAKDVKLQSESAKTKEWTETFLKQEGVVSPSEESKEIEILEAME